jgi:hypothetical protein
MDFSHGVFYRTWADNSNSTRDNPNGALHGLNVYTAQGTVTTPLVTPVFSNLSSPTITYGASTTILSGNLAAGSAFPTGDPVSITLNGVTQTAVVDANGNFSSSFATINLPPSGYVITYSFAGDGTKFSAALNGSGMLTVQPAPLVAAGINVASTAGAPFSGTIATFVNADPAGSAASYSATITWGDGSISTGVVGGTGSSLTVSGTHTYADPGSDRVQVTISHNLGYTTSTRLHDRMLSELFRIIAASVAA